MDLWAIDIGTSRTHATLFLAGREPVSAAWANGEAEAVARWLADTCLAHGSPDLPVVVSSVNAAQFARIEPLLADSLGRRPLRIRDEVPIPMKTAVRNPAAVGTDRLCDAVAAVRLAGAPAVVADAGSAVTVDAVDRAGCFLGGSILPGLGTQAEALRRMAPHLPLVDPCQPADLPGADTQSAIAAGIRFGMAGAVREIHRRLCERIGPAPLLLTGGQAACLLDLLADLRPRHEPDLCCLGIRAVYEQWAAAGNTP